MPSRATLPKDVVKATVYPGNYGFRYTCRNAEGRVVYDSPLAFRSRYQAREDILSHWPKCKVSFEVI